MNPSSYSMPAQQQPDESRPKRHMKIKIPKNQAKVVTDEEMRALQVEAASKLFYSHIAFATTKSYHGTDENLEQICKSTAPLINPIFLI